MNYLLDTDTSIGYLNGMAYTAPLLRTLSAADPDQLGISLATYGELLAGIPYGRNPQAAAQTLRAFLRLVQLVPITRAIMRRYAQLKADLGHRGQLIGDFDTLIAATALHHDLTLVTRNLRHFQRIPDLKLYQRRTP